MLAAISAHGRTAITRVVLVVVFAVLITIALPTRSEPLATQAQQLTQIRLITTHLHTGREPILFQGSGVILGDLFVTAYHNLVPPTGSSYRSTSFLAGIEVRPLAVDKEADLAVIRIPKPLCATWCNDFAAPPVAETKLDQAVEWVRILRNQEQWKHARVQSLTERQQQPAPNATRASSCDLGLVLEVTEAFLPGSSGAPVWDQRTHRLLGMALGSFELSNGRDYGYFTPLRCIYRFLDNKGVLRPLAQRFN